jgi:hypothetical protein
MSAFILGTDHIDYLVTAAIDLGTTNHGASSLYWRQHSGHGVGSYVRLDRHNADAFGALLIQENVASIRYLYPDWDDLPDPSAYTYRRFRPFDGHDTADIAQVCKAVACYEYQTCEHPGWETSEAKRICEQITKGYLTRLPGYEDAQWEVTRDEEREA